MGKFALVFWWASTMPIPNVDSSSVTLGAAGTSQVQIAGIQMRGVTFYDKADECTAEQGKLNDQHKDDVIVISACWRAGSGFMILGVPKD